MPRGRSASPLVTRQRIRAQQENMRPTSGQAFLPTERRQCLIPPTTVLICAWTLFSGTAAFGGSIQPPKQTLRAAQSSIGMI